MKFFNKQKNILNLRFYREGNFIGGFTLIETMVAIFILTTSLVSMLSLTTSSLFASKYANNEITASYLLQEAVDYIRNDRDSIAFQQIDYVNGGWSAFIKKYKDDGGCFSQDGCYIEVAKTSSNTISPCSVSPIWGTLRCPILKYDASASSTSRNFYNYISTAKDSNFKRTIKMQQNYSNSDEIDITVTVEWLNGNIVRSRSLRSSLLNWLI
jgi:Tfp pilus assembly protein PilV